MNLKSFSKSTLIYSVGTIALRFTTFLLIPLYTHYLTQAEFGLLQTLLLTIQVIITINDIGMRSALMRFFAEYEIKNKLNELLGSSFTLNILIGLIFIIAAIFIPDSFLANLFSIDIIPNLLLITILLGIGQTLSLNILSYFRAKDQGVVYMIISLVTSLLLIVLTYIFLVVLNQGIIGILWAQSISFFSMWIIILFFIIYKHGLTLNSNTFTVLLKFGFPLIFAMSGDLIINTSGNYFLGHFHSLEHVAIYSLAYKIASIGIMVLINPFQMAYEPFVFRNKDDKNLSSLISRITLFIVLTFILVGWGLLFIFRDLITVIGPPEYSNAYVFIYLILPGIGAMVLNYVGQSLLHIKNKTRITGTIVLVSTLISLILSYFMIKYFDIIGLILSINFYLFLSSIALYYFGIKEVKVNLDYNRLFIVIILGIILYISVYFLREMNDYIYYLATPTIFVVSLILLWKSSFFSESDKFNLLQYLKKVKFS